MQQSDSLPAPLYRHHQRVHDQWGIPISFHRPAHCAPGAEVENNSNLEPAFRGPDVGEVGQPVLVRPVGLEVPVENVLSDHRPFTIIPRLSPTHRSCPQDIDPHQPFDQVKSADQSFLQDIAPDAMRAIGPISCLEARLDHGDKLGVITLAGGGRAGQPSMEAGPSDIQNLAEPGDRADVTVFGNEGEPHINAREKKAAAFFRISRSARSRAIFFFSAAISARSARI